MYTRNKEFYDIVGKVLQHWDILGINRWKHGLMTCLPKNTMRNKRSPKWVSR